jgi:hypothetical protein
MGSVLQFSLPGCCAPPGPPKLGADFPDDRVVFDPEGAADLELSRPVLGARKTTFSMADRDSWWSVFIHKRYAAESAVDRLLDWASSPFRKHNLERSSATLHATAVCWPFLKPD